MEQEGVRFSYMFLCSPEAKCVCVQKHIEWPPLLLPGVVNFSVGLKIARDMENRVKTHGGVGVKCS